MTTAHPTEVAAQRPDAIAYVMASTGERVTYAQLDRWSNQVAHWLRGAGVHRGDHVALLLENHPRFFVVAWGAQRAGVYWTAISTRLTRDEVAYIVGDCEARVLFTSDAYRDIASSIAVEHVVNVDELDGVLAEFPSTPIDDESEGVDMLYSSGTTGRPKGIVVPLPKGPLGSRLGVAQLARDLFSFDESTVYLSTAPLYHAAPLRFSMGTHRLGGTVVVLEHFDAESALAAIEAYQVTHSQWVPTMFVRLLRLPDHIRDKYDLSSQRVVLHAAAPCPPDVKHQMIDWWGPIIWEYYGGTEGNGFAYCSSEEWLGHRGTVGRLLAGSVHICDEDGAELPVGQSGTIWFGETPRFEYHRDPEHTAASRHPSGNGWTTLGDVGYVDEDGYLYLTDRRAFTIVTGGVNVYPREAEDVLITHPAVADVAVFGVPNEEFGEEVKAVVQPVDAASAGPELEAELLAWCRDRLSHVKSPRSIDFRDELPRGPNGKLYKAELRDEYWRGRSTRVGN